LIRDTVDERIISNIVTQTGTLINSQNEVGGWDPYQMEQRPTDWDIDNDGIPDVWEEDNGMNPKDPDDHKKDQDGDGYTNLEEYLNSLCK